MGQQRADTTVDAAPAARRGPDEHHSETGHRSGGHDTNGPARPCGAADRRVSDLRRHSQRHEVLADGSQGDGCARPQRADVCRALRVVLQPGAVGMLCGDAAAQGSPGSARQVRGRPLPDEEVFDRLPRPLGEAPHAKRQDKETYQTTAKLLEASVAQRVVSMRYHSQRAGARGLYRPPYRLVHAQGGRS